MILDERHQSLRQTTDETNPHPAYRVKHGLKAIEDAQLPGTSMDELMPCLASSTADLRAAAEKGFDETCQWLNVLNHSRWWKKRDVSSFAEREANLTNLRSSLAEYRATNLFTLLEPFREGFDSKGTLKPEYTSSIKLSARDLFKCHVFTTNLIAFALALIEVLSLALEIERANPKARMHFPVRVAKNVVESANEKNAVGNPLDMSTNAEESSDTESLNADDASEGENISKEKRIRVYGTFHIRSSVVVDPFQPEIQTRAIPGIRYSEVLEHSRYCGGH